VQHRGDHRAHNVLVSGDIANSTESPQTSIPEPFSPVKYLLRKMIVLSKLYVLKVSAAFIRELLYRPTSDTQASAHQLHPEQQTFLDKTYGKSWNAWTQ
jgi:hypothetical protein